MTRVPRARSPKATPRSISTRSARNFPAIQDIVKYVVDKGKSQVSSKDKVGENFYDRAVLNAALVAEAIRTDAQKQSDRQEAGQRRGRAPGI